MPSSASAYQPRNINHLDKSLSLSLSLSQAASQALNPLGLMTGSALLFQHSSSELKCNQRKQIWVSPFLKTVYYYIWAKLDYSNVTGIEAKACGHRP